MSAHQPPPFSASKRFYDVIELRTRVLGYLKHKELASIIRVEKKGMALVAGKLYHTMNYQQVKSKMTITSPRSKMYCDAITVINTRGMTLTPANIRDLKIADVPKGRGKGKYLNKWLGEYHPELIDVITPFLRRKCPGLKRIIFGQHHEYSHFGYPSWSVEFGTPPNSDISRHPSDFVDIVHTVELKSLPTAAQVTNIEDISVPSSYHLRSRFDLKISSSGSRESEGWNVLLRKNPLFAKIYKAVDFGRIGIDLQTIISLCQRQRQAGHCQLLEYISARSAAPYSIYDFQSLANVVPPSLSELTLCCAVKDADMSFTDLEDLISMVRTSPRNLRKLAITMKDMEIAESICADFLSEDTIRTGGNLCELEIQGNASPVPMFNTLRCCSAMMRLDCKIKMPDPPQPEYGTFAFDGFEQKADFVNYLLKESRQRRAKLSTVDFAALGLEGLADITLLEYDDEGRPQPVSAKSIERRKAKCGSFTMMPMADFNRQFFGNFV